MIASGAYGEVFEAVHVEKKYNCVVKMEDRDTPYSVLKIEAQFLRMLNETKMHGVPTIYSLGRTDKKRYMSMQQLGPSLSHLISFCDNKISIKTTLMIARQVLNRLQDLHKRNIVHSDIKP